MTRWVSSFQVRTRAPALEVATCSAKKRNKESRGNKRGIEKEMVDKKEKLVERTKINKGRRGNRRKSAREKEERKKENFIDIVRLKSRLPFSIFFHESCKKTVATVATSAVLHKTCAGSVDDLLKPSGLSVGMKL